MGTKVWPASYTSSMNIIVTYYEQGASEALLSSMNPHAITQGFGIHVCEKYTNSLL